MRSIWSTFDRFVVDSVSLCDIESVLSSIGKRQTKATTWCDDRIVTYQICSTARHWRGVIFFFQLDFSLHRFCWTKNATSARYDTHKKSEEPLLGGAYYHNASCSFRWLLTTKQTLTHLILLMFSFIGWSMPASFVQVHLLIRFFCSKTSRSSFSLSFYIISLHVSVLKSYYVHLRAYAVNNRFR